MSRFVWDKFRVEGIEASAGLDPANAKAFITTVTFTGEGTFSGTMTPIARDLVPAPRTYAYLLAGLGTLAAVARRRAGKPGHGAQLEASVIGNPVFRSRDPLTHCSTDVLRKATPFPVSNIPAEAQSCRVRGDVF